MSRHSRKKQVRKAYGFLDRYGAKLLVGQMTEAIDGLIRENLIRPDKYSVVTKRITEDGDVYFDINLSVPQKVECSIKWR